MGGPPAGFLPRGPRARFPLPPKRAFPVFLPHAPGAAVPGLCGLWKQALPWAQRESVGRKLKTPSLLPRRVPLAGIELGPWSHQADAPSHFMGWLCGRGTGPGLSGTSRGRR